LSGMPTRLNANSGALPRWSGRPRSKWPSLPWRRRKGCMPGDERLGAAPCGLEAWGAWWGFAGASPCGLGASPCGLRPHKTTPQDDPTRRPHTQGSTVQVKKSPIAHLKSVPFLDYSSHLIVSCRRKIRDAHRWWPPCSPNRPAFMAAAAIVFMVQKASYEKPNIDKLGPLAARARAGGFWVG
jgi:hypothetical protein